MLFCIVTFNLWLHYRAFAASANLRVINVFIIINNKLLTYLLNLSSAVKYPITRWQYRHCTAGPYAGIDGGCVSTFLSPPLPFHPLPSSPSPPLRSRAPLNQLGVCGALWAPPAGSGAERRPKTNSVHSRAFRKLLGAIISSVLKCIFYRFNTKTSAERGVLAPHQPAYTLSTPLLRSILSGFFVSKLQLSQYVALTQLNVPGLVTRGPHRRGLVLASSVNKHYVTKAITHRWRQRTCWPRSRPSTLAHIHIHVSAGGVASRRSARRQHVNTPVQGQTTNADIESVLRDSSHVAVINLRSVNQLQDLTMRTLLFTKTISLS